MRLLILFRRKFSAGQVSLLRRTDVLGYWLMRTEAKEAQISVAYGLKGLLTGSG